jgi:uncharacterized protein with PIN domain
MKFLVDSMCGRLARWLRLLGQDAEYERDADDGALAARARRESRILLTRDHKLLERRSARGGFLVQGNGPMEELRQVIEAFDLPLDEEHLFSRCVVCNRPIEPVPREEVAGEVPPYVYRTQTAFRRCPECGRIFWAATHREHVLARLHKLLGRRQAAVSEEDAEVSPTAGPDRGQA